MSRKYPIGYPKMIPCKCRVCGTPVERKIFSPSQQKLIEDRAMCKQHRQQLHHRQILPKWYLTRETQ